MKYVFRVLSSEVKKNVYTTKSGKQYYEIPLAYRKEERDRTCRLIVPAEKTYKKGDSLYLVLDSTSLSKDIILSIGKSLDITDDQALSIINMDYINYIIDDGYNHKISHAVNHLMPIGIRKMRDDGETDIDRWSKQISFLLQKYGKDFIAINPVINDSLYPFHYVNFLEHKFVREYRSNLIMFSLLYDNNHYEFHDKNIYFKNKNELILMYEMIEDEQFYNICDNKDKINNATTPFLKSFNDHGLAKEIIEFMKEDEIYLQRIKNIYGQIRDEMKLGNEKTKKYFIPSLESMRAIMSRHDLEQGKTVSDAERANLEKHLETRMNKLVDLYDKNKIFYFSSDELIIDEDNVNINSALKRIIDMDIEDITYHQDTRTVYNITDYNGKDLYTPILEVVTKQELKELQEQIYRKWIEQKKKKSR